jgi:hypothetical protein
MAREFTCERARDDAGKHFSDLGFVGPEDPRNAIRFTLVAHPDSTWLKSSKGCYESAPAFP